MGDDNNMMPVPASLFAEGLGPENGTTYRINDAIAALFPNHVILKLDKSFDLQEHANEGRSTAVMRVTPHPDVDTSWRRNHGLRQSTTTGLFDVSWRDAEAGSTHSFVVAVAEWPETFGKKTFSWVIGEDRAVLERFTNEVCAFCNEPRDAVLAFRGGCWQKDREIYKAIQSASFDELVLAGAMANEIREDFSSFLAAKEEYAKYGVPWKRGVLFLGPPGNGKTHCLRATIKLLDVPCLYVQSLKTRYEPDDVNIARVFDRAREVTPCCLVFEDLDAMITAENRSTFLNQLDGFANASGMLTLATTNHPENLDPAILERPSRFDRKYHFALPAPSERGRYIAKWRERLDAAMRINDQEVDTLVRETDGFSFAYLKELFLSAMIRWIKAKSPGTMFSILESQLQTLRDQMRTEPEATPKPKSLPKNDDE